jgi:endonuclease/exonuclease/phosphatase family metal-dependent hydrolase
VVALAGFLVMPSEDEHEQAAAQPSRQASTAAVDASAAAVKRPAPTATVTVTATAPPVRRTVTARPAPAATVTLPVPGPTMWRHTTSRVREVPVPGQTVRRTVTAPPEPAATVTIPGPIVTVTSPGPTVTVTSAPAAPSTPPAEDPPGPAPPDDTEPGTRPGAAVYRVASYNVLGHSHTAPGGTRASWAAGTTRITWVIRLLRRHRIDLVGLQELQRPQWWVLRHRAREYRVWPGPADQRDTDNAVAWRGSVWQLVRARTIGIPYFHGTIRQMPVLLLRHRGSGKRVWFANFHNPASLPWLGSQRRHREEALRRQARLANRLKQRGYPVLVTGDMNDTRWYFCPFARLTRMHAASGGQAARGRCQLPDNPGIDWIFGTRDVRFTGYTEVDSPLARRTSDHPMIWAAAGTRGPGQ